MHSVSRFRTFGKSDDYEPPTNRQRHDELQRLVRDRIIAARHSAVPAGNDYLGIDRRAPPARPHIRCFGEELLRPPSTLERNLVLIRRLPSDVDDDDDDEYFSHHLHSFTRETHLCSISVFHCRCRLAFHARNSQFHTFIMDITNDTNRN